MNYKKLVPLAIAASGLLVGLSVFADTTSPTPKPKSERQAAIEAKRALARQCAADRRIIEQDHQNTLKNARQVHAKSLEGARTTYLATLKQAHTDKSKDAAKVARDAYNAARRSAQTAWAEAKRAANNKLAGDRATWKEKCHAKTTTSTSPTASATP